MCTISGAIDFYIIICLTGIPCVLKDPNMELQLMQFNSIP